VDLREAASLLSTMEVTIALSKASVTGVPVCTLRPREAMEVALSFAPSRRVQAFSEELFALLSNRPRALLMLHGACQAMEVRLETEAVPFGPVVRNATATRRVQLENQGDIGTRFEWDPLQLAPHFAISPLSGFIGPGEDVTFELTFRPSELSRDLFARPTLRVEGSRALPLSLSGQCVEATAAEKPLLFRSKVRERVVQNIPLKNTALSLWRIKPVISSTEWEGDELIELAAGETKNYALTYCPLTMTKEGKHDAQIFFPLPDGTAHLYRLEGISDPPALTGVVSVEVPARVKKPILLQVTNWLKVTQRFLVRVGRKDGKDEEMTLKGHDHFDVPALQMREYALHLYAHKEGTTQAEVTFENEKTDEFVRYELKVKVLPPSVASTISLSGAVRQLVTHAMDVDNPLDVPLSLTVSCDLPEVIVPSTLLLGAGMAAVLNLSWRPLVKGSREATLTLSSAELGNIVHKVRLEAIGAADVRTLQFKAGLGGSQLQSFRFANYLRGSGPAVYKCAVKSGTDFEVEVKDVAAPPADGTTGSEVSVEIRFEPSRLGEVADTLTIAHPDGGEYVCNLLGLGSEPGRLGPIVIKAGQTVQVPFKNVLNANVEFASSASPAGAFAVGKPRETIPAKKGAAIAVSFKPEPGTPAGTRVDGQLVVIANAPASATGSEGPLQWVVYLRGET